LTIQRVVILNGGASRREGPYDDSNYEEVCGRVIAAGSLTILITAVVNETDVRFLGGLSSSSE
jgi:hypothetical protein